MPTVRRVSAFERADEHRHGGFQVLAPLSGRLRLEAVGPSTVLEGPTLALVWPHVGHRAGAEGGAVDLFAVELAPALLEAAAASLGQALSPPSSGWALLEQPGPLVRELVFALATPATTPATAVHPMLEATERYFAMVLVERLTHGAAVVDVAQYKSVIVQRAVAWIHAHPGTSLTTADLGRRVGASERTLTRRFKEEVGQALAAYVTATRMRRAAELLMHTDESVEGVAAAVGYTSTSHFHRAFRRVHGSTPQQVRDRHAAQPVR